MDAGPVQMVSAMTALGIWEDILATVTVDILDRAVDMADMATITGF